MAVEDKKISYRMYFVAFMFFMMAVVYIDKTELIFNGLKEIITEN
jgi:hypothetical protein